MAEQTPHMRRSNRLTPRQRAALDLLSRHGVGVVTSGETALLDGQPWVNWRTAYSLYDKGLVGVRSYGEEDAEVFIPSAFYDQP